MVPRVIKTDADYEDALAQIESLMGRSPQSGTPEGDLLELFSLLVEAYENTQFPIPNPSPVEAIVFRMEQEGLTNRDLIPFIGNRSKVSEILSSKRSLTLSMIRALHDGLGIPAEVLLGKLGASLPKEANIDWSRFPIKEMAKRGWIQKTRNLVDYAEETMREFMQPCYGTGKSALLYRLNLHKRSARQMDEYSLLAWTVRIISRAIEEPFSAKCDLDRINTKFLTEVAQTSWSDRGPILAKELLAKYGIQLVIEPHLPRTHLDGAALLLRKQSRVVIGLTLRHDRLDNFWFCLLHELAHIAEHLKTDDTVFIDDLDVASSNDPKEKEADRIAGDALIPRKHWRRSSAFRIGTTQSIRETAAKLRIHPAIIAGRIRHDSGNYRILNQLIGRGEVRRLFQDQARWDV